MNHCKKRHRNDWTSQPSECEYHKQQNRLARIPVKGPSLIAQGANFGIDSSIGIVKVVWRLRKFIPQEFVAFQQNIWIIGIRLLAKSANQTTDGVHDIDEGVII